MNELDLHYPPEKCPFCGIAEAFPYSESTSTSTPTSLPTSSLPSSTTTPSSEVRSPSYFDVDLAKCIPTDQTADPEKTSPSSFVVLAAQNVLAFLDILPMTQGHLLVASRGHRVKVADLEAGEGADIGFWLPVLARVVAKVTGVGDYNIVQNNGARAAQVVPHVHFHIIPRPASKPEIKSKSWTMFGRGQREELDDEEGAKIAGEMRRVLREEVERMGGSARL